MEKETDYKGLFRLFTRSIVISTLGMIFPFLYILFPSMYVAESVKEGIIKVMATLLAVVLLLGAFMGPVQAIVVFTIFGPFILIFHYMITTKRSVSMTILATSLIFFTFGINSEVLNSKETINAITEFYKNLAGEDLLSSGTMAIFTENVELYYKRFLQILPSVLIITSLVTSYVTYTWAGRSLLARGVFIIQPSSLEFLKFPREIIILSLVSLALFSLTGDYFGPTGQVFMINLMNLVFFMLYVSGLAIAKFYMTRFGVKRFLQFILIGLSFTISSLQIFVIILGGLDQIVNFRKIK